MGCQTIYSWYDPTCSPENLILFIIIKRPFLQHRSLNISQNFHNYCFCHSYITQFLNLRKTHEQRRNLSYCMIYHFAICNRLCIWLILNTQITCWSGLKNALPTNANYQSISNRSRVELILSDIDIHI